MASDDRYEVLESTPISSLVSESDRRLPDGNIKHRCGDIHTTLDLTNNSIHSTLRVPGENRDFHNS